MGPPGGGKTRITQRYVRHFNVLNFVPFDNDSLNRVFGSIMDWFLNKGHQGSVKSLGTAVVQATINVYDTISDTLLPTPTKSHYTFNLRDMSKVVQGILQVLPPALPDKDSFVRLWHHECMRVFHDRLVSADDRKWFVNMMATKVKENFNIDIKKIVINPSDPVLYGNFIDPRSITKPYVEIKDMSKLQKVMDD